MTDRPARPLLIEPAQLRRPTLKRMTRAERIGYQTNLAVRSALMRGLRRGFELGGRLTRRRFACRALSGDSTYNLCVNADLSVSCNCNDIRGAGRLGSLRRSTFEEVFSGPVATSFRSALAIGRLPIAECARCPELLRVGASEATRKAAHYAFPRGVLFENNANCNLSCVGCGRAERPLESLKMHIADVRHVSRELRRIGVDDIFYFSLGEPFMSRNILEEMRAIREDHASTRITTSTNGVLLDTDDKRRAAMMMDEVIISLDGCSQETVARYQVGSDFAKAYENMQRLVAARDAAGATRPTITWKYVVFRWNDRASHVARTLDLARMAGVDVLEFVFTASPYWGISPRFHVSRHWRRLAPVTGGRRVVALRARPPLEPRPVS